MLPARGRSAQRRCQRRVTSLFMPREPLEAILLVGGQGTRLRPLTLSAPKPLLPTAGVPFLAHMLARAADSGVTHVVLATCYKAEMFRSCFGDGSAFGLFIDYVQEEVPLDTAGGIRNAAASLRDGGAADPIVVFNSDVLSGHDLGAQVDLHCKADAAVTLHLVEVADPSRFGCVPTDETGRVTGFLEKTPNPVTNRINAGCYVFRRDVIARIPAGRPVSVERETFPGLIEAGELVMGYHESAYWLDVGTPETFVRGIVRPGPRAPAGARGARPGRALPASSRAPRWRRTPRWPAGPSWARARRSPPGPTCSAACCSTTASGRRGRRGPRLDRRPRRRGGPRRGARRRGDRRRGVRRARQRTGPRASGSGPASGSSRPRSASPRTCDARAGRAAPMPAATVPVTRTRRLTRGTAREWQAPVRASTSGSPSPRTAAAAAIPPTASTRRAPSGAPR